MRLRLFLAVSIGAALVLAIHSGGCSMIGLGIGAIADSSTPDYAISPLGWETAPLERGEFVEVTLTEGGNVRGYYDHVERVTHREYRVDYEEALVTADAHPFLPPLGEDVVMALARPQDPDSLLHCEIVGFDYGFVVVHTGKLAATEERSIALGFVRSIRVPDGHEIDGPTLNRLTFNRQVPHLSVLVLRAESKGRGGEIKVAMDEVLQVRTKTKKKGKITGFLIGLTVDVVLVAIAASADTSPKSTSGGGGDCYSCPFVYSFDGENYVLDSETFGGALFRAAQRTDVDNLDHVKEVGGEYLLRLANELPETQYVDELKLLVVDHPPGTSVLPSFDGSLHVLSSPHPPREALDFAGHDVTHLVHSTDDDAWASNPFGRDPTVKSEARDGLELTFPRPPDASSVKLALNVQNTLWASHVQGQLLALHGRRLQDWYDLMNASQPARDTLTKAMIREGMLLAKLWNGSEWETAGFVWEVGPVLPKDQIVVLDLRDVPGEELRVRLESTAGFWIVNSVQADYEADPVVEVREVAFTEARDWRGEDVGGLLRSNDGRHYVMAAERDWADLVFPVPPPRPSLDRSTLLKSTGYYTIHVTSEGEPRSDLLARLLSEPGAYGQFTLQLLNERAVEVEPVSAEVP